MKLKDDEETKSITGSSRFPRWYLTALWTAPRLEQAKEASSQKLVTTSVTWGKATSDCRRVWRKWREYKWTMSCAGSRLKSWRTRTRCSERSSSSTASSWSERRHRNNWDRTSHWGEPTTWTCHWCCGGWGEKQIRWFWKKKKKDLWRITLSLVITSSSSFRVTNPSPAICGCTWLFQFYRDKTPLQLSRSVLQENMSSHLCCSAVPALAMKTEPLLNLSCD